MKGATVRYRASRDAAFDAVATAVHARGYTIVRSDRDLGTIVFAPDDVIWWIRAAGFQVAVHVSDRGDGTVDTHAESGTPVDMGETDKVTGKVIHEVNKILGPGTLIEGKLALPDAASELRRFLFVMAFFVVIIAAFFLLVWLRGLPLIR